MSQILLYPFSSNIKKVEKLTCACGNMKGPTCPILLLLVEFVIYYNPLL